MADWSHRIQGESLGDRDNSAIAMQTMASPSPSFSWLNLVPIDVH